MSEEDFIKLISQIPKDESNKTLSTYGSINVDDLQNAVKRLRKIPDYEELLKENKYLQQRIDKAIEYIETHYLEANEPKLLSILKGEDDK